MVCKGTGKKKEIGPKNGEMGGWEEERRSG